VTPLPAVTSLPHVYLVRHTAVDETLRGTCYGRSDVALSAEGHAAIAPIVDRLAGVGPTQIVHSGLGRTRLVAERLSAATGVPIVVDDRLIEFNFGAWELQTWDAIFGDVGHNMAKLIHEPATYRPQGGETVHEMAARVLAWFAEQAGADGPVIAMTHGGPISLVRGTLAGLPAARWPEYIPPYGTIVRGDGTVV